MFPKAISSGRNALGQLAIGSGLNLRETSTAASFIQDSTTISSPDVDDSVKYEINVGAGYIEKTSAEIQATTYSTITAFRKRLYNSYFDVYGSYVNGTLADTATGGLATKSAQLVSLGTLTIAAFSGPIAGTTDVELTVPVAMNGYTLRVTTSGTMYDNFAPFGSYAYSVTVDTVVSGTTENIALTYNPPGGCGSYYGNYGVEAFLAYAYVDGPVAQGSSVLDSGTF